MVASAFLLGIWTAIRRGRREPLAPELFYDLIPWLVGGAIVGARAFYVVSYWRESFAQAPLWHVVAVWHGGLVYYGGLLGAAAAVIFYARWKKLPLWALADALAPSIALGQVLGRIGCFLNGCCYGRPTALPWAVVYPQEHETHGLAAVHPTQLYEALLNLALFVILEWLHARRRFRGQVFAVYLVAYAGLRSLVELFRGDYPRLVAGWVTPAHWVSLLMLAAGVLLLVKLPRTNPQRP